MDTQTKEPTDGHFGTIKEQADIVEQVISCTLIMLKRITKDSSVLEKDWEQHLLTFATALSSTFGIIDKNTEKEVAKEILMRALLASLGDKDNEH